MNHEQPAFGECNKIRSRIFLFIKKPSAMKPEIREEIIHHLKQCSICRHIYEELGGNQALAG